MSDTYEHNLLLVVEQLKYVAQTIDIRGHGAGQFVFATHQQRAIELSQSSEGIWVECWNDQSDGPVMEATFGTYAEAIVYARTWLQGVDGVEHRPIRSS